ncbi:MAG TPA: ABC transporter substrate-binding protein [bacterium]|nr:ABC transporter substrate-binding protein [bacterium]HOL47594.1 ABC transporter substrate-binding protein [bacterium]HPQ18723.1 ABC transporter substrate-binding protein [bacterium]
MKKNILILIGLFCFTAALFSAEKIAVVKSASLATYDVAIDGFKESILMAGIKNEIEIYDMKGDDNIAKEIIEQIKNDKNIKLIFTLGARASDMIASEIKDIPIIFSYVLNWKNYPSLKQKNVTGIEFEIPPNITLTLFKMLAPDIKKIGIIYNEKNSMEIVKEITKECENNNLILITENISSPSKIKSAFKNLLKQNINAFWFIADPILTQDRKQFSELIENCNKEKLFTITVTEKLVELFGVLFAVAPDYKTIGSQAGSLVQNIILNNKSIVDLPVETPMGTVNVLNKKTSDSIGLTINDFLIRMFNNVYE